MNFHTHASRSITSVQQALKSLEQSTGYSFEGPIKLRDFDAARVPRSPFIWHVNALPCTFQPGKVYAGLEIATAGDQTEDGKPLVYEELLGAWRCESTHPVFSLANIEPAYLPLCIGKPSSYEELAKLMVNRYAGLREWTPDNAMSLPVALTLFTPVEQG